MRNIPGKPDCERDEPAVPEKIHQETAPRSLLKSSLIYAIGDLLTKGARIILIPYFIACLTKEDVGTLAVLQAVVFATWTLLSFGFGHAVQRFYNEYGDQRERFTTTLWLSRMIAAVPFYLLLVLAGGFFAQHSATIPVELIWLAITAGFFRAALNITELWFVIREQALAYRTFTFLQFLTTTLLTIYFITGRGWGVTGAMLAELISYSIWSLVACVIHFRAGLPKAGIVNWRDCLSYCLPVLPHALFMWGVSFIDRLLLEGEVPTSEIGEYHIGYLLASVVSIGALAMRSAWLPRFFKQEDSKTGGREFGKTATLFFYLVLLAALGAFTFAPEIVALFSMFGSADYGRAADVLRIVVVGIAGYSIFLGFNQPLFYQRRIGLLASISGLGLAVNITANLILIPGYGIFGAAIATVAAYWTFAGVLMTVIARVYKVHWQYSTLIFWSICAALFGLIVLIVPTPIGVGRVAVKTGLILAFIAVTLLKLKRIESGRLAIGTRFFETRTNEHPKIS